MMKWSKHGLWSSFSWVDLSLSNCPLACLLVFLAKYLLSTCCVTLDKLLYPSETYSSLANWKLAPQRLSCKEPTWVRKIPWRRKWLPTPAAFLDNTKDRGAWQATVHGITKSPTWLSDRSHTKKQTMPPSKLRINKAIYLFFEQFLLEYSCLTGLHYFLLYSEVNQLYVYILLLLFSH